mgnify:CR=1 FL=1
MTQSSTCVGKCQMDLFTQSCSGCGRTMEQIKNTSNWNRLLNNVVRWGHGKSIIFFANAGKQLRKSKEELDELTEAARTGVREDIELELGDVLVTLIIFAECLNIDLTTCLAKAYLKISARKGKTINGIFVKEEDLSEHP